LQLGVLDGLGVGLWVGFALGFGVLVWVGFGDGLALVFEGDGLAGAWTGTVTLSPMWMSLGCDL
jgi:hypothetical protein